MIESREICDWCLKPIERRECDEIAPGDGNAWRVAFKVNHLDTRGWHEAHLHLRCAADMLRKAVKP